MLECVLKTVSCRGVCVGHFKLLLGHFNLLCSVEVLQPVPTRREPHEKPTFHSAKGIVGLFFL